MAISWSIEEEIMERHLEQWEKDKIIQEGWEKDNQEEAKARKILLQPKDLLDESISDTVALCLAKTHMEPAKKTNNKKSIVKKRKKNPQRKIKNYFKAVKPKKNFQGFNRSDCTYQPSIQDHVYIPDGYGERYMKKKFSEYPPNLCKYCNLAPCIMKEHSDDIRDMGRKFKIETGEDNKGVRNLLAKYVHSLMEKYLGKRYMKKMEVPVCVDAYLLDRGYDSSGDESSGYFDLDYQGGPMEGCKWDWTYFLLLSSF